MNIIVDTSVWADYFKGKKQADKLNRLIDDNLICTNDLILAELIPFLRIQNQIEIIKLLNGVAKIELKINWNEIINLQTKCIKNGINNVGIPDLIILQNTIQNNLTLFTFDKHFKLIKKFIQFELLYNQ